MPRLLVLPLLIIAPFVGSLLLRTATGDAIIASVLSLTLLVTLIAWFAEPHGTGRNARKG